MSNEPVLVPKKKVTIKKHKLALKQAKEKINRVLTGEPRIIKSKAIASNQKSSPGSAPQRGKRPYLEKRDIVKVAREGGLSRERASAKYNVPYETIRKWEHRYKWATPEAIAVKAHHMKLEMAGIKPAIRKEDKLVNKNEGAIMRAQELSQAEEALKEKALTLIQIGETNAERVAKEMSNLLKQSFEKKLIKAPESISDAATAFKMVEQATGRNKPQQVNVQLGVSVSPHMSSIIGDIRPGTVTLDADIVQEDLSPTWLSSQLTDDQDAGL